MRTTTSRICLCLLAMLFSQTVFLFAGDKPEFDEWQVIHIGGQRVGYSHHEVHSRTQNNRKIYTAEQLTSFRMTRLGGVLKLTQSQRTEEDEFGNLIQLASLTENPPTSRTELVGWVKNKELLTETTIAGKKHSQTMPWAEDVKSPLWLERDLVAHPLEDGEKRKYKMYEMELNKITDVTLTDLGMKETSLPTGNRTLRCARMTVAALPGINIDSWLDDRGATVKVSSALMKMDLYTVTREQAWAEASGQLAEVATETFVKVAKLDSPHSKFRAVYRVKVADRESQALLSNGPTQTTKSISNDTVEVRVESVDPLTSKDVSGPAPSTDSLKATMFLDFDDPAVQALNREIPQDDSPRKTAVALEKFVKQKLKGNYSTAMATASEVARSLEGDCTEHAVLLAALLRARKIPSRVVAGLVYTEKDSAFGGHMWTEAWLGGQWVPLDATIGRGRVGVGHLRVADSSLTETAPAPMEALLPLIHLLGHMQIECLSLE